MEHYLDNSSTTKVHDKVAQKIQNMLLECYANPSSLHSFGLMAEKEIESARQIIARSVNAGESEIFFTSGGTESDNLAILGAANAKKRQGKKIITTQAEHAAVLESFEHLKIQGFETVYVPLNFGGAIDLEFYENCLSSDVILVSAMLVNNELGNIFPIKQMAQMLKSKSPDALFHCDAVQGYGKMDTDVRDLGVDLMTISAHKIHGPKGAGALYIKKGVKILPLMYGGAQESGLRSGTENTAAIAGFGVASHMIDVKRDKEKFSALNDYLRKRLTSELPQIKINSGAYCAPHILNISFVPYRSETVVHALEKEDIFVSSGSACSSKKSRAPYLLKAGFTNEEADSAVRISFGAYSDERDVDALIDALKNCAQTLLGRL